MQRIPKKELLVVSEFLATLANEQPEQTEQPVVNEVSSESSNNLMQPHSASPAIEVTAPRMTFCFIIGHTRRAQGANSKPPLNMSEYLFNTQVAAHAVAYVQQLGHDAFIETRDQGGISGAYNRAEAANPDAIIELHFNYFSKPSANGTEILYNRNGHSNNAALADEFLAMQVQDTANKTGYVPKSRAKDGHLILDRGARGFVNVSQVYSCPSILLEPFFGSNLKECEVAAQLGPRGYGEMYAKACVNYSKLRRHTLNQKTNA